MTQFTASRIRRLDGGLLLVFRALVRHRSGTAAAADLNLSQSAVSHALARLRDVFDDPLFRRLPHGLEPTARALGLLPEVEEVLQRLEDLTDSAPAFESETSTRRFAVSTSEFVTALLGADLTQRFAEQAPHASLGIAHLARDHLAGALRRGEVDLAIGRLEELSGTEFVLSELFVDEYCVVARAGHPQIRKRIGPRQYNDAAHVFAHSSSELGPLDANVDYSELNERILVPHWLSALGIAAGSDAIATCPRRLALSLAPQFNLQVLKPPFAALPIVVSMARRRDVRDHGIDWLAEQVQRAVRVTT